MRLQLLGAAIVVAGISAGLSPSSGEQPSGPATLENLLDQKDLSIPPPVPHGEADRQGSARPDGTFVRPVGGVQHPDLDAAWAKYQEAVDVATSQLRAQIEKVRREARTKGDLDSALHFQQALAALDQKGKMPDDEVLRDGVAEIRESHRKAAATLLSAYSNLTKTLTKDLGVDESAAVSVSKEGQLLRAEAGGDLGLPLQQPGQREIYLSDLEEQNPLVGYGLFGKNGSLGYGDRRIVVSGKESRKGLSMHPHEKGLSKVTYGVPKGAQVFVARAAIDDSGGAAQLTQLLFKVYGGKRLLWQSPPIKGQGVAVDCRVDLKGARTVTLVVECPGRNRAAHAVWIDPLFIVE